MLKKLALISTLVAVMVVGLGAWTRLVDAGLGCPDWPGCYGFLTVPQTPEKIAIAEARFPETPVEVEKGWPEMIHRYFASALGVLIIAMTVLAWRQKKRLDSDQASPSRALLGHCLLLLGVVIAQGLFGMWTVTLKLWPQVVAGHLMGGFTTLALLFLLFLRTHHAAPSVRAVRLESTQLRRLFRLSAVVLCLVLLQIFLGAWTAANYASLACGSELPTCHNEWWPRMDFAAGFNLLQSIGPNYLGGQLDNDARTAIHVAHRSGAVILTLAMLWLLVRLWQTGQGWLRQSVIIVASVLALQLGLGVVNVLLLTPLPIAIAHNLVGAALLLAMVLCMYRIHLLRAAVNAPSRSQLPSFETRPLMSSS